MRCGLSDLQKGVDDGDEMLLYDNLKVGSCSSRKGGFEVCKTLERLSVESRGDGNENSSVVAIVVN